MKSERGFVGSVVDYMSRAIGSVNGRALIAALAIGLWGSGHVWAQSQATPAHVLAWDQQETTTDLSFESQIDGQPPAPALGATCSGTVCRSTLTQSLTAGTHKVTIRAYRIVSGVRRDGPWSPEFTFNMVADPTIPRNLRLELPPGSPGIAVNGVIDRPPFKEKGLDVVSIAVDGGAGTVLVGTAGLRGIDSSYVIRPGNRAAVMVWQPIAPFMPPAEAQSPAVEP